MRLPPPNASKSLLRANRFTTRDGEGEGDGEGEREEEDPVRYCQSRAVREGRELCEVVCEVPEVPEVVCDVVCEVVWRAEAAAAPRDLPEEGRCRRFLVWTVVLTAGDAARAGAAARALVRVFTPMRTTAHIIFSSSRPGTP